MDRYRIAHPDAVEGEPPIMVVRFRTGWMPFVFSLKLVFIQ
jgi:hypothetical protein